MMWIVAGGAIELARHISGKVLMKRIRRHTRMTAGAELLERR